MAIFVSRRIVKPSDCWREGGRAGAPHHDHPGRVHASCFFPEPAAQHTTAPLTETAPKYSGKPSPVKRERGETSRGIAVSFQRSAVSGKAEEERPEG